MTDDVQSPQALAEGAAPAAETVSDAPAEQTEQAAENPAVVAETAAEPKAKGKRPRRGPPADRGDEVRTTVLLTTSRYQDGQGGVLRRGRPVNIPESRLDGLLLKGKVRVPAKGELERALATWPAVDLF